MTLVAPTLDRLAHSVEVFNGYRNVDRTWHEFVAQTAPGPDLARPEHRRLLHRWLNSWGCRIRYPRDGEPPGRWPRSPRRTRCCSSPA
ncbi:hypothetical protein ABZS66_42735, partial [Dactylosporangium sp. NPDC005572]